MKKIIILGGSGNGLVIAATIERNKIGECIGFLNDVDDIGALLGIKKKIPVIGKTDEITEYLKKDGDLSVITAYGGFTNPVATLKRIKELDIPPERWLTIIDQTAVVSFDYCEIGTNCFLGPLVQMSANAVIKDHCTLLGNSFVGHDSVVGEFCHIASNAVIGSFVNIGSGVHVGLNCTIRENIKIGDNSIIGAGAVIVKDVPENSIVVGNPGRILKYRDNGLFVRGGGE